MIRWVAIVSLTALLVLVLYLPSAYPPAHFVARLRAEHEQLASVWSESHAERVLTRTLSAQESAKAGSPVPNQNQAPDTSGVNSAVAQEMSAVNARLFGNPYFRSIDSLLVLASYRFFALVEWLPWMMVFCCAALFDGMALRAVKAKQFAHHDPEFFALYACGAIMVACATVVAMVLPFALPMFVLPGSLVTLAMLVAGALSNFHRRG